MALDATFSSKIMSLALTFYLHIHIYIIDLDIYIYIWRLKFSMFKTESSIFYTPSNKNNRNDLPFLFQLTTTSFQASVQKL